MDVGQRENIALAVLLSMTLLAGCTSGGTGNVSGSGKTDAPPTTKGTTVLSIYHAGSLAVPFEALEKTFEALHPDIDIQREAAGSVKSVRKMTELGKTPDVLATADYSLIPSMTIPDHASWYAAFATNELVIAYNEKSAYRDEITTDNWFEVLRRPDVKFGFSNPNDDPCGYRATMINLLAETHYRDDKIFKDLIASNVAFTVENDTRVVVPKSEAFDPNTKKVLIRSMETELLAALESGEIDYFFIYRSVAIQHHLDFIELPREINLGATEHGDFYMKYSLQQATGKVVQAKPIVYGVTIPDKAVHPELATQFLALLLGEEGQKIFADLGQPPIVPPMSSDPGKLPQELRPLVLAENK
ncbi:MAG: tungstate ABC transporter substrate-binding protein WtpA [Candidatus Undinarchaeales archaeon]|jgi:molybdate/tungstate transport system substrate-binding protein|nr:tungstate ABC transporter substrate-binding protein WtpA [Candidatus Undinarchaeales archaeon]MDP7491537.1 tungstate ABC transporter substrate-binding protein WtpA [Candidatus Undinarchaeales archaeon]